VDSTDARALFSFSAAGCKAQASQEAGAVAGDTVESTVAAARVHAEPAKPSGDDTRASWAARTSPTGWHVAM